MYKVDNKINEVLRSNEEGVFILELDSEGIERAKSHLEGGRIQRESINDGKVSFISIKGNVLEIKISDVKEFRDELFTRAEKFLRDERDDTFFKYPEVMKDLIEESSNISPYLRVIGEDFSKRINNKRYRGYLTKIEGDSNSLIVTKSFVARYEVLIFRKSNKPYVKIKRLSEDATLYRPNRKNFIREDKDVTRFLYSNLDRFMEANNIHDNDIVISKDSIKKFYSFDDIYFITPTKKWVEMWWNYDCPYLYRFEPNFNGNTNMWGLGLVCWRNLLVEASWDYTGIDESITEREIDLFTGDYPRTAIYKQAQRVLKARTITEEEKRRKIKEAERIEERIQEVINRNKKEILLNTLEEFISKEEFEDVLSNLTLYDSSDIHDILARKDGTMGLDCGFCYTSLKGREDLFKEIAEYDDANNFRNKNGDLKINLPVSVQSTTIQRTVARKTAKVVEDELGYRLNYWTVLD